tara:strand:- start:2361 stop:2660 length:300 start_codon:yes stop_codon:yes gene_type:complete
MESRDLKTLCVDSIDAACVSRGKRRGCLKATCPPTGSNAAAAWQALMIKANPCKVSIGQMLFMGDDQRAIYDAITAAIADVDLRGMDKDRVALEGLGAW